MKKLVLGTLICLAACGEFEPKFGSPEDHAVPQIVPDELGLKQSRVLMSPGRHIRFVQPDDWELYEYDAVAGVSYFRGAKRPDKEHHLVGIMYHPQERVVCRLTSEVELDVPESSMFAEGTLEKQLDYIFLQAAQSKLLEGFMDEQWLHRDNQTTPAPVHEMQWYTILWDSDYPALGFGVSEATDHTSTHALCYWVDGARGNNEVELLTQVRAAVRFVGVG